MKKIIATMCLSSAATALAGDWQLLFDGKSLDGWEQTQGYYATNDVLVCTKQGGKMVTTKEFGDFEMEFDFKLTPGANNGIGIRCKKEGDAAYQGMEIQVLDDSAPQYAKLHDYQFHGSIYGVVPAKRGHQKPIGEWNHERILAQGDHILIELNGVVITEAMLSQVAPIDGKQHPGLHWPKGRIGLLGHHAEVEFRNMRIHELDAASTTQAAADNMPPEGFTALFNGKDLSNWKGLVANPPKRAKMTPAELAAAQQKADEDMRAHWRIENGELVFDGKGHNLCSAKDYGDFELWVDWLIQPKGDSGIYLRGSPQVQIWDPDNPAEVKNGADKGSGALWNNRKAGNRPLVRADHPIGQWNTFFIRMVGENVTIYLNGKLVVDNVPLENYWDRNQPIYPTGAIELQSHGSILRFKNIYVRELPR